MQIESFPDNFLILCLEAQIMESARIKHEQCLGKQKIHI